MVLLMKWNVRQFTMLIGVLLIFSCTYFFLCDTTDFGGISTVQDAMRDYISEYVAKDQLKTVESFKEEKISDAIKKVNNDIKVKRFTWYRLFDMIYFSVSNTVTMGYGDIYPISMKAKSLVILQMLFLLAVICMR